MHIHRRVIGMAITVSLAACSLEPKYKVPEAPSSQSFKEASALTPDETGSWQKARPAENQPRGEWWRVFQDPALDDFEQKALAANQNLKAAADRVLEARAAVKAVHSQAFPFVSTGFGPARQLDSPASLGVIPGTQTEPQNVWRAQVSVSYEVDLFGRISSQTHAAKADEQESEALLRSLQLALEADVAQNYFDLRELDAELEILRQTVELRQQELTFVQHRFDDGDVSELDLAQAKSEVELARSEAMTLQRRRATTEHALAILLGQAPAMLTVAANPIVDVEIKIPAGMPSSLLERRPDISAAERAMAAANARVGVARAAFFPSLSLTGTGGYESSNLNNLFNWSNRAFLLGPLVGTPLNLPIFDGGLRRANLKQAHANYDEQVALYRQQVLTAFKEVEDNLVNVRILKDQIGVENSAVQDTARAAKLSRTQYEDGQVAYLDVIDSERILLETRRSAVQLVGAEEDSTVGLIRSLGGGWSNSTDGAPSATSGRSAPAAGLAFRSP